MRKAIAAFLLFGMIGILSAKQPALAQGASCPIAFAAPVTITGSSYTLTNDDQCGVFVFTYSSGSVAVTLPAANRLTPGWEATLIARGNDVVVTPTSGTINGSSSFTIAQGLNATLYGSGISAYVVAGPGAGGMTVTASNAQLPTASKNLRQSIDVRNFGAVCDWNGSTGTDDTTAIQAALDWSVASPGTPITGETGAKCKITQTLTVSKSYSALLGAYAFAGTHHDAGTTTANDTNFTLVWGGSVGGTMMDIEPAAGAGALVGNIVKGVAFECNSTAAYGLVAKSIRFGDFDVYEHECTTAGMLTTAVAAAVVGENLDFYFNRVRVDGYQSTSAGFILQMTGNANGNSDYNDVWVTGAYKDQTGLFIGNTDNNRFWAPHLFQRPGGSATYGLDCSGATGGACRSNKFFGFDTATAIFRGTGNPSGIATTGNIIFGTDLTNNQPDPTIESGALVALYRDDGSATLGPLGGTSDTKTVWTSWTPALSCNTGTLTTSSATGTYKTLGKSVFVRLHATLTDIGTCAVQLVTTVPVARDTTTLNQQQPILCRESGATGNTYLWTIGNFSISGGTINKYDGTFSISNGYAFDCNGTYESN